jgi:hypothetical protein
VLSDDDPLELLTDPESDEPPSLELVELVLAAVVVVLAAVLAWANGMLETTSTSTPAPTSAATVSERLSLERRRSAASRECWARVDMSALIASGEGHVPVL